MNKVADLERLVEGHREAKADAIGCLWHTWNNQRRVWIEEQKELRNYLFATDTSTTSNSELPWKNSTTSPKLTQIRDNLHANYISSLFPNEEWLKWESYSLNPEEQRKKEAIQSYMANKTRQGGFRSTVSDLLYDYIDTGNAFADEEFINKTRVEKTSGIRVPVFIGPSAIRISPYDIVFDPTGVSVKDSPVVIRSIKTIGELRAEIEDKPDMVSIERALSQRFNMKQLSGQYSMEDFDKALGYQVDGFGSLYEYYQSNFVEILEFRGDYYDVAEDVLYRNRRITVMDRSIVLRDEEAPNWIQGSGVKHVGWRKRPDNLWAMGPLNNLVGMQYRIDHLENLKADVFDFIAFPPLKIKGDVDEFDWEPGAEIHLDENADVQMLVPDSTALNADFQIKMLEDKMEMFAGAPREAMGIRTPGEKTAFEVESLQNAAGRIFQEKITNFEISLLEPLLNDMLEIAKYNMVIEDVIRVMDDDLGIESVMAVSKEDITSTGKLKPVGARHFAAQSRLIQNLSGIFNGPLGQILAPHTSAKQLAKLTEDTLNLKRFDLFQDNVAIFEQAETQRLMNQVQEDLQVEQMTPTEGNEDEML